MIEQTKKPAINVQQAINRIGELAAVFKNNIEMIKLQMTDKSGVFDTTFLELQYNLEVKSYEYYNLLLAYYTRQLDKPPAMTEMLQAEANVFGYLISNYSTEFILQNKAKLN